ncbi:hypothetical protein G6F52_006357 [Rhizopus delemar]|nr:hypothetical protein G6F52_006357 [Rhizopus delemar]
MSLAGYFFGNVDEQGRLESDLDEELKETLSSVDAGVMSKIFSDNTFGLEQAKTADDEEDEDEEDAIEAISRSTIPTAHASDAVDYSDFNEAVPDDPMFSEKYFRRGMGVVQKNLPRSRLSLVTDNYDDEEEEEESLKVKQEIEPATFLNNFKNVDMNQSKKEKTQEVDVQQLFPGFEKGKVLKFSDLFMTRIQRPPKLLPNKRAQYDDSYEYEIERDDRILFMKTSKWDRLRLEQAKQPVKRRKIEALDEDIRSTSSSGNESDYDDYLEDLPDRL